MLPKEQAGWHNHQTPFACLDGIPTVRLRDSDYSNVEYPSRESSPSREDTPVAGPSRPPPTISSPQLLSAFNIEINSSMSRKGKGREVETPVDNRVDVSEFLEWGA